MENRKMQLLEAEYRRHMSLIMENRKMQLLEAECRRHMSLMRADPAREREHREVAEAILWALDKLRGEGKP